MLQPPSSSFKLNDVSFPFSEPVLADVPAGVRESETLTRVESKGYCGNHDGLRVMLMAREDKPIREDLTRRDEMRWRKRDRVNMVAR